MRHFSWNFGLAPENGEVHFLLAEALFQQQDFPAAKASYLQATQLEPQSSRAYYGLIKTCTRLGEESEVEQYSQEFQRVESAIDRADQEARRRYDDLQQIRERLAVTCADAGCLYGERQNLPMAEQLWARAVAVDAKNRASRSYLASLYATQGKHVEAIRLYQELLELDPQNAVYCQQLGFLQAREGDLQAAEDSLRKAIRIAPQRAAGYRASRQTVPQYRARDGSGATTIGDSGQARAGGRQLLRAELVECQDGPASGSPVGNSTSDAARPRECHVSQTVRSHPRSSTVSTAVSFRLRRRERPLRQPLRRLLGGVDRFRRPIATRLRHVSCDARQATVGILLIGTFLCAGLGSALLAEPSILFHDMTSRTGITFRHTDGSRGQYFIVEYVWPGWPCSTMTATATWTSTSSTELPLPGTRRDRATDETPSTATTATGSSPT